MEIKDFNPSVELLNVIHFNQNNITKENTLPYASISLRIKSKAKIITDKNTFNLSSGDLLIIPSGTNYIRQSEYDDVISFDFQLTRSCIHDIHIIHPKDFGLFCSYFQKAFDVWKSKQVGYKARCTALLYEVIAMLQQEESNLNKEKNKTPELITQAISIIHNEFDNPELSVKRIAKEVFVSDVYLRKLFSLHIGTTPKKYINNLRIEYACTLLKSCQYTTQEISEKSGFYDTSYFCSTFKKHTGYTPSEYSKNAI